MMQEQEQNTNENSRSAPFAEQMLVLRKQLEAGELKWTQTAVSHLKQSWTQTDAAINPQNMDMLSLAVDAALDGKDIAVEYPQFYERLLENSELATFFFDTMAAAEEPDTLPILASGNLSFLKRNISDPPLIRFPHLPSLPDVWEAVWRVVPETLNRLFAPSIPVYRSAGLLLDVENTILLYNEFEAGGETWEATLEALAHPDAPGQVELFLTVSTDREPLPLLRATVQWGEYRQTAVLDTFGRNHFPPFAVENVLDEGKTAVSRNLHLKLQPIL